MARNNAEVAGLMELREFLKALMLDEELAPSKEALGGVVDRARMPATQEEVMGQVDPPRAGDMGVVRSEPESRRIAAPMLDQITSESLGPSRQALENVKKRANSEDDEDEEERRRRRSNSNSKSY